MWGSGPLGRRLGYGSALGTVAALALKLIGDAAGNGVFGKVGIVIFVVATALGAILDRRRGRRGESEPVEESRAAPNTPLPPPAGLVGRDSVVDSVADTLDRQGVVLVHGAGGVGVSTVAVEAARRVVPDADRQDYVNLLGYNQRKPDGARRVAIRVLTALGLDRSLARNLDAAGRRVRDRLRERGRLLLVDNVTQADQVAWLLDHVPGAHLVVAGTFDTADLPWPAVSVESLDPDSALRLAARQDTEDHPGPSVAGRIEADPRHARELAEKYLGRARAAIAIGEWLARNPRLSIPDVLHDLDSREPSSRAEYVRKSLLSGASADARALLATLALVPVTVLPEAAVAALIDRDTTRTAALLDELIDQGVVERLRPTRYLVLAEARSLGHTAGGASRRGPARLIGYYGRRAAEHARALSSGARPDAVARAQQWFGTEDTALTQLLGTSDPPRRAAADLWRIADALEIWFTSENRLADRRDVAEAMVHAAQGLGDRAAWQTGLIRLTAICRASGDIAEANAHLVVLQGLVGDAALRGRGSSTFHTNRGLLYLAEGLFDQAHREFQRSAKRRPRNDDIGAVVDLVNLGGVLLRQDHLDEAYARLSEALALAERVEDVTGQACARELLGVVAYRQHDQAQARELWARARWLHEQRGDDTGVARCLAHEATAVLDQDGDPDEAADLLRRSLDLRGTRDAGVGPALTHLRLAELAARSGRTALVCQHRDEGLAALRGWERRLQEPPEVTAVRDRLRAVAPESGRP